MFDISLGNVFMRGGSNFTKHKVSDIDDVVFIYIYRETLKVEPRNSSTELYSHTPKGVCVCKEGPLYFTVGNLF